MVKRGKGTDKTNGFHDGPSRLDGGRHTPTTSAKGARCPICRSPTEQAFRPFCSKRCADIDLARWLGGTYAIAGHADAEEDETPPADVREKARHPSDEDE